MEPGMKRTIDDYQVMRTKAFSECARNISSGGKERAGKKYLFTTTTLIPKRFKQHLIFTNSFAVTEDRHHCNAQKRIHTLTDS